MRKTFSLLTALVASICLCVSCNIEGEEPLEEDIMTSEEFSAEIVVDSATDLTDGWWTVKVGGFEKCENGNYKQVPFIGCFNEDIYFNIQDGKIKDIKIWNWHNWENVTLTEVPQIEINKNDKLFSIHTPVFFLIDNILVKCDNNNIVALESLTEKQLKNGNRTYLGYIFNFIGTELPQKEKADNNNGEFPNYLPD